MSIHHARKQIDFFTGHKAYVKGKVFSVFMTHYPRGSILPQADNI